MPTTEPSKPRALVALSGGVDSSAAAVLLQEDGFEVVGVFMRNGISHAAGAAAKSCCSASDSRDAALVADRLGIPFYAVDLEREFGALIDHFAAEYRRGRTPNPCVLCNQHLKFGQLFAFADAMGADVVATGHYAAIRDGALYRARDADKDQTYYLFGVDRKVLPRMRFPLGELTKAETRAVARRHGLVTADKQESMEICFVGSGGYRDIVAARGGRGRAGAFVDRSGAVLGAHDGIDGFTVGQRRGLPALGVPHYVLAIRPATGEVVLGQRQELGVARARARQINWLVEPRAAALRLDVKVRARSPAVPARVTADGDAAAIEFERPVDAVTPGQAAVFYDGDRVLGGGWLD